MLTAWPTLSQEDTVRLSVKVARSVAIDLIDLDRLRASEPIYLSMISNYKGQINNLIDVSKLKTDQNFLLSRNIEILESQLVTEKSRKPKIKILPWILGIISAGGLGYILGSI